MVISGDSSNDSDSKSQPHSSRRSSDRPRRRDRRQLRVRRVSLLVARAIAGIMSVVVTRRPTRLEVSVGVGYLVILLALTWLALADPYTYAYWVRFIILLPTSLVAFCFDYPLAILLFGPDPTSWVATAYYTAVAIAGGVMQLALVWMLRKRK